MGNKGHHAGPARRRPASRGARSVETKSRSSPAPTSSSPGHPLGAQSRARAVPGTHLHVVTLLLLHLRVDTQLFPGTQHTHPGPGGRDKRGVQEPEGTNPQCHPAARACTVGGTAGDRAHTRTQGARGSGWGPGLGRRSLCCITRSEQGHKAGTWSRLEETPPTPPRRRLGQDTRTPTALQDSDTRQSLPLHVPTTVTHTHS